MAGDKINKEQKGRQLPGRLSKSGRKTRQELREQEEKVEKRRGGGWSEREGVLSGKQVKREVNNPWHAKDNA